MSRICVCDPAIELSNQPWNSFSLRFLLIKQLRLTFPFAVKNISLFRFWDPFLRCVCWGDFPTPTKHYLDTIRVSYVVQLSCDRIWRQHRFHRLRAQPHKAVSSQLQMPLESPRSSPNFRPVGCKLEGPTTSFLGLIHLLEQLTELRETLTFPVY